MGRFVLRRLVFIVTVCVAIVFFSIFGLRMSVNSVATRPRYDVVGTARYAAQDTVRYLRRASQGDLGQTSQGNGARQQAVPVTTVVRETYGKSMGLLGFSLLVAACFGLIAGVVAAVRRRSPLAILTLTLTLLGISTPSFFAALLLQVGEIQWLRVFGFRLVPVGGFGWDAHIILPALVLAARPLAQLARVTYMSLSETLEQDYVRTAAAKGLSKLQILHGHALRNAAVPILTAVGVSLRFSLGSLPVVEYYFNWPGLGAALLDGIRGRDTQLVVSLALALGLTFMLINLVLDVVYRLIDPRLREVGQPLR
jgi:peptide/nickel transport system permease protein